MGKGGMGTYRKRGNLEGEGGERGEDSREGN